MNTRDDAVLDTGYDQPFPAREPMQPLPKKGSLVTLISGGPAMTVVDTHFHDQDVFVAWFVEAELQTAAFPIATLRPSETH